MADGAIRNIPTKKAAELLSMSVRNFLYRKKKAGIKGLKVQEHGHEKKYYSSEDLERISESR